MRLRAATHSRSRNSCLLAPAAKKSLHRQIARRGSSLPRPQWPVFTLFTDMAHDDATKEAASVSGSASVLPPGTTLIDGGSSPAPQLGTIITAVVMEDDGDVDD